jgi:hypothetical protein
MQDQQDLFGQVPVTWPEVVDWVARVAGITPDSPRFIPYVTLWSVPDKIRAAKIAEAVKQLRP